MKATKAGVGYIPINGSLRALCAVCGKLREVFFTTAHGQSICSKECEREYFEIDKGRTQ